MATKSINPNKSTKNTLSKPHLLPKNTAEAKQNLSFFRNNSPYSQEDMAKMLNIKVSTYGMWEANLNKSTGGIRAKYIKKTANILNCDPNLINPACPLLYKTQYKKYPPIKIGAKIVFCNESPKTSKDIGANIKYFIAITGVTIKTLSKRIGFSVSTLNKWVSGVCKNEERARKVAQTFKCPVELIYLPDNTCKVKSLSKSDLQFYALPTSLKQLKENLRYHIHNSALSIRALANKVNLTQYRLKAALNIESGSYLDDEEIKAIASVVGFEAKDALMSSINFKVFVPIKHSFESNAVDYQNVPANSFLYKVNLSGYASGGAPCDLQPSQCNETLASSMSIWHDSKIHSVRVIGDSMYNPETGEGIRSGVTVLVDSNCRNVEHVLDKVVCIRLDGDEMIIKRLKRKNGVLYACSDNPYFEPQQLPLPENAELLGECIYTFMRIE